ncbi:MAG: Flp pilus assembly complex ATPase component TadA, partial [Acidimicrobiia bacterium]|nr:Flp pilus assembly complex ATPase component TadA [Acidimicrobiia bacterium]
LSTVHANSPTEALWRLETLAMSGDHRAAGATVRNQLRAAVDLIVQMERRDGHRRISEIEAVA